MIHSYSFILPKEENYANAVVLRGNSKIQCIVMWSVCPLPISQFPCHLVLLMKTKVVPFLVLGTSILFRS